MKIKALPLLLLAPVVLAEHAIETIEVVGTQTQSVLVATDKNMYTADSGDILKNIPGANVNKNGALTGIAQYRGMYGDRVNVLINGSSVAGGGPNAMDTPLHYSPAALTESLTVIRGIAPVSSGQQTIGGTVVAETIQGEFSTDENWQMNGVLEVGGNTSASGRHGIVNLVVADDTHKIRAAALAEMGDDYEYPEGEVTPSEYERDRQELSYAFEGDSHSFSVTGMNNETGETGTPALPMDIIYVDTVMGQMKYGFTGDDFALTANVFYNDAEHVMNNFAMRQAPMNQREALTVGEGLEAKLQVELGHTGHLWRIGADYHQEEHNADISDPSNPMFFVYNFNEVETAVTGLFVETEQALTEGLSLDAGLRVNQVSADAGEVDTSMAGMNPMMANMRNAFNAADRDQSDTNVDAVAKLYYQANEAVKLYAGVGHKTRSASYQERYLWMPMESTGGLADARTYIGNIELDPEQANELELGVDFNDSEVVVAPRVFYRDVSDYIQGTPTMMTDSNGKAVLQFNNVDAKIYGFDMPWHWGMTDSLALRGSLSAVRGERKDIDDNLYRISPDNAVVAVDFSRGALRSSFEAVAYAKQDNVSETNTELETSGYSIYNLYGSYSFASDAVMLSAGVNNLFDKHYLNHLGGYNRVNGSDIAVGDRLPGVGRSIFAKVRWAF